VADGTASQSGGMTDDSWSNSPDAALNRGTVVALVLLLVMALLGPLALTTMGQGDGSGLGNSLRQVGYVLVALMAFFATRGRPMCRPLRVLPLGLVVPLGWALISLVWSVDPLLGARRLALTFLVMWTICVGVRDVGYAGALRILRWVLTVALVANYLSVALLPSFAMMDAQAEDRNIIGTWQGFLIQKNFSGPITAITVLVLLFDVRGFWAKARWLVLPAALFFLYKTGSRTSELALAGAFVGGTAYRFYDARFRAMAIPLLFIGCASWALYAYFVVDPWVVLYSNASSLSGRDQIWQMVWRFAVDHWWQGAGYGSFWGVGPNGPQQLYGKKGWLWDIYEGHNGYLDLLAAMGFPGLVMVVLGSFGQPMLRLLSSRRANGARGALLVALLSFAMIHNSGESTLFDRDGTSWIYMLFAIALTFVITPDVKITLRRPRLVNGRLVVAPIVGTGEPTDTSVAPVSGDEPVGKPAVPEI
jgi:exopolysaccharide production protein ExoQ